MSVANTNKQTNNCVHEKQRKKKDKHNELFMLQLRLLSSVLMTVSNRSQ